MAGIESYVPDRVHTYSTRLGTKIQPPIGPCMALVLHLVDPHFMYPIGYTICAPNWVHNRCTQLSVPQYSASGHLQTKGDIIRQTYCQTTILTSTMQCCKIQCDCAALTACVSILLYNSKGLSNNLICYHHLSNTETEIG